MLKITYSPCSAQLAQLSRINKKNHRFLLIISHHAPSEGRGCILSLNDSLSIAICNPQVPTVALLLLELKAESDVRVLSLGRRCVVFWYFKSRMIKHEQSQIISDKVP